MALQLLDIRELDQRNVQGIVEVFTAGWNARARSILNRPNEKDDDV
jgi:hypothetical protein